MEKSLALFDFDGTITHKDSFIDFIRYAVGTTRLVLGLFWLSPAIVAYFAKLLRNDQLKTIFLKHFFKMWTCEKFKTTASQYSRDRLPQLLKTSALDRIQWHRDQQHVIYIVSASPEDWLLPWCQSHSLQLISTELEKIDNRITGNMRTPNCHGQEKVKRIQAVLSLDTFESIYAYGDSSGDKPMLALAQHKYYRNFR
jgi:phosphatidylglycerophosphatase C